MDLFRKFPAWFVSGAGLASGVAVVAWAMSLAESRPTATVPLPELPVAEATLSEIESISVTDHVAFSALLTSKTQGSISVQVEASVVEGGRILYNCPAQAFSVKAPSTPERIQYECCGAQKNRIPAGARVELGVKRVSRIPT